MKKILFISVRDPFSDRYSGDVIRSKKFVQYLLKKNNVTVVCLGKNNKVSTSKKLIIRSYKKDNLLKFLFNIMLSFVKLKPLHFSFFYSSKIKEFIDDHYQNYDIIFCQSIRSFQFLSDKIYKKVILDMGDLYSKNYFQTFQELSFINPLKIIYFFESIFVKKYERYCLRTADKILLFSKKEMLFLKDVEKNKIMQINFGIEKIKKLYKFNKNNYKIIFIGNIKYTPNRRACLNFIKKILPKLKSKFPNIEFHVFGEIRDVDKNFFLKAEGVKFYGKIKNLEPYLSKVICGLANLNISTGIQTKLLTYMSYGIPSISSKQVLENFDKISSHKMVYFKNDTDLINLIIKFRENKHFSNQSSKRSLSAIKNFKWEKVLKVFNEIV